MFSYSQSAFFVVASMAVSMFVVAVLNRVWPISSRKLVNDVTGSQLGILTLAAIADLARPFEGAVSVSPVAFERALALMQ